MKKILIVEDDPMLSEIYKKKFEKNDNFEILIAASGIEAQEKAKKEIPDLILLDLVLPEMDGFDVLADLRKESSLDNTKIVPFSNLSQEDNRKKLKDLGADGFISKSEHTPSQLIAEVEKILVENEKKIIPIKTIPNAKPSANFSTEDQKRVLIVEDEEVFLEVFSNKLEAAGFEVGKASTGKEGHGLLSQKNFGLVVVDSVLPDMDAKTIITEFKTRLPQAKTKFIVLRNESDLEKDIDKLKTLGIQSVIDKNKIDPEQFVLEVKKFLK